MTMLRWLAAVFAVVHTAAEARPVESGDSSFALGDAQRPRLTKDGIVNKMERWLEDLPTMPHSHSPDSPQWSNSFAVCAIMRDENITDVREWIHYYKWLGADHIFLADNDSANSAWITRQLASEFPRSFLSVRRELTPKAQLKAYAWCVEEQRHSFNWLAFFDLDEFLVLRPGKAGVGAAPALKPFLDEYKHEAGLVVNWVLMGPSGRETRPEGGGVLEAYTQCVPQPDRHLKTIANTFFIEGTALHPHNMEFREGRLPVDEHHTTVPRRWSPMPVQFLQPGELPWSNARCTRAADEAQPPTDLETFCYKTAAPMRMQEGTADRVALFHYGTKSVQDFRAKVQRGSGLSNHAKGQEYFDGIASGQQDAPICREPLALAPLCCGAAAGGKARKSPAPSLRARAQDEDGDDKYHVSVELFSARISRRYSSAERPREVPLDVAGLLLGAVFGSVFAFTCGGVLLYLSKRRKSKTAQR